MARSKMVVGKYRMVPHVCLAMAMVGLLAVFCLHSWYTVPAVLPTVLPSTSTTEDIEKATTPTIKHQTEVISKIDARLKKSGIVCPSLDTEEGPQDQLRDVTHVKERMSMPSSGKNKTTIILLMSSLGRSGSSWVGGLLSSTYDEIMYLFEPLKIITDVCDLPLTTRLVNDILTSLFNCEIDENFVRFYNSWKVAVPKFPNECSYSKNCESAEGMSQRCKKAKTILIKTIRLPLFMVEPLLRDPDYKHLKIIYIARDIRAQIASRELLASDTKLPDRSQECDRVMIDVNSFHKLAQRYPGSLYFLRYEDISRNPIGEAHHMWRFVAGIKDAPLPQVWRRFLLNHSQEKPANQLYSYTIYRNTKDQWYNWRFNEDLSQSKLSQIENGCRKPLLKLGYHLLNNTDNLRNLSIPFIGLYDCKFWNCRSFRA